MPEDCTCGSPVSPDDTNCPHCGKPLSPEQAAREQAEARERAAREQAEAREVAEARELLERGPWEPRYSTQGVLLFNTLIPACTAVALQDLVAAATISAELLSLCISLWAGFAAVILFHWKFPKYLYPDLARGLGTITGMLMVLIAGVLDAFSTRVEWPIKSVMEAAAYVEAHSIAARLASGMTPEWRLMLAVLACLSAFALVHTVAATLGSIIAISIFPGRTRR